MLTSLQFVKGAVAKKDMVPVLTNFRIHNGRVTGYNGLLGLSAPIDTELDVIPNAQQFLRAIEACQATVALTLTENRRLQVSSGPFRVFVDCNDADTFPDLRPVGMRYPVPPSFLTALKYLDRFIAKDASRSWACGVLFDGASAFATNNIVLIEYWLGFNCPYRINLPAMAVREVLRIGEPPEALQMDERRVILHYSDGRWLSSQLLAIEWPDVHPLFERAKTTQQKPFPDAFFPTIESLTPFTNELGQIFFHCDRVSTAQQHEVAGASVLLHGTPKKGCYNADQLIALQGVADTVDFDMYPAPAMFFGKLARGIIAGFLP